MKQMDCGEWIVSSPYGNVLSSSYCMSQCCAVPLYCMSQCLWSTAVTLL